MLAILATLSILAISVILAILTIDVFQSITLGKVKVEFWYTFVEFGTHLWNLVHICGFCDFVDFVI